MYKINTLNSICPILQNLVAPNYNTNLKLKQIRDVISKWRDVLFIEHKQNIQLKSNASLFVYADIHSGTKSSRNFRS